MKVSFIHISDLHLKNGFYEQQSGLLSALIDDIASQLKHGRLGEVYLAFTGDVVYSGGSSSQYLEVLEKLSSLLDKIGLDKSKRIIVPGNHDVSREFVISRRIEHNGVVTQNLPEGGFNDYIESAPDLIIGKFENYLKFQSEFSGFGISIKSIGGSGVDLSCGVGVYCLNSALMSAAGVEQYSDGRGDQGRLSVDTRSLHKWINSSTSEVKILLMHHPLDWLSDWSREDLRRVLKSNFCLRLFGHSHDQDAVNLIYGNDGLVDVAAPALLTTKEGDLGYSIVTIDTSSGVETIQYRQWTRHRTFRPGVDFSNTDDGFVRFNDGLGRRQAGLQDGILVALQEYLDEALVSYADQPKVWVVPRVSRKSDSQVEYGSSAEDQFTVDLDDFVANPLNTFIKAPPQFGLTCLSHYLRKRAWEIGKIPWIRIDAKIHKYHSAEKEISRQLLFYSKTASDIGAILVDSWSTGDKDHFKLIARISAVHPNIPIIILQSVDDHRIGMSGSTEKLDREYGVLYLCSLSRNRIRKIVTAYNDKRQIADDHVVVERVVSDIDALNLHRTPLICLTLLKASEVEFDESPVNRTEMLKKVLFILFDFSSVQTYKNRPDLKDCEYVLGRFCEVIVRERSYIFSREKFVSVIREFCKKQVIDLDITVVFDVLYRNNIIVGIGEDFCFRFSYWIHYFAAQRMHQDKEFCSFILGDMNYASYPEMMEFYTGIDRARDDALEVIIRDITSVCDDIDSKCGLPPGMNPYQFLQWNVSDEIFKKMQDEIGEDVLNSNLPDAVKDQYADRGYRPAQPYNQTIQNVLREYSMPLLMRSVAAASRALRNSDYADPEFKRRLLDVIMRCMEQISRVLLVIAPLLAKNRVAAFEGQGFTLMDNFSEAEDRRLLEIILAIPNNVVGWYFEDMNSRKMGPLLSDFMAREDGGLQRHEMIILMIKSRPRGWKKIVEDYIEEITKNSFYLFDVYKALRAQYMYAFVPNETFVEIKNLLKMTMVKHKHGVDRPGPKAIGKVKDSDLPERRAEGDGD